jgi:hypothetical protein
MGIEEYEFLTRTMEEISELSTKLTNKREQLSELKSNIREDTSHISDLKKDIKRAEGSPLLSKVELQNTSRIEIKTKRKACQEKLDSLEERKNGMILDLDAAAGIWFVMVFGLIFGYTIGVVLGVPGFGFECRGEEGTNEPDTHHIPLWMVNDGDRECADGSDESLTEDEIEKHEKKEDSQWAVTLILPAVIALFILKDHSRKYPELADQIQKEHERIEELDKLKELKKKLNSINDELIGKRKTIEVLQKRIPEHERGALDKTKTVERLERELDVLWDSIAHLIPFSTALEKA